MGPRPAAALAAAWGGSPYTACKVQRRRQHINFSALLIGLPACLPTALPYRQPHWVIVDSLQGGSGQAFDWRELRAQAGGFATLASHGWLLAGGLSPDSVAGRWGAPPASQGRTGCVQAAGQPSNDDAPGSSSLCPRPALVTPPPADAIATAAPSGVDVSSGVCGPDGLKKDLGKVQAYCSRAAAAFVAAAAGQAQR